MFSNEVHAIKFSFDCSSKDKALLLVFDAGTTVKNLLAPYDEVELGNSSIALAINGSELFNGCVDEFDMKA
jgi:alpha-1,3-glucan synthase